MNEHVSPIYKKMVSISIASNMLVYWRVFWDFLYIPWLVVVGGNEGCWSELTGRAGYTVQGGPLLAISRVITPISRVIPQVTHL